MESCGKSATDEENINQSKKMKHTHTPGPWEISFSDVVRDSKGRKIADCELTPFDERPKPANSEDIANALLIAAAPDLLATLGAIAKQAEFSALAFPNALGRGDLLAIAQMARAVIAKATGKGDA